MTNILLIKLTICTVSAVIGTINWAHCVHFSRITWWNILYGIIGIFGTLLGCIVVIMSMFFVLVSFIIASFFSLMIVSFRILRLKINMNKTLIKW